MERMGSIITYDCRPDLHNVIFIEGLPGVGNVGKIAADFISYKLKAERMATIISGDLPAGITLGTSGVLSGVPTRAEICTFEVRVSVPDFPNITDTATYTLSAVNPGTVPTTPNSSGSSGGGGCSTGFGVSVLGVCATLFVRKGRRAHE